MAAPGPTGLHPTHRGKVDLHRLQGEHRAIDAGIDFLPLAGLLTRVERCQHTSQQRQRAGVVGNQCAAGQGAVVRHAILGHNATRGLGQGVAARPLHPRSLRPPG